MWAPIFVSFQFLFCIKFQLQILIISPAVITIIAAMNEEAAISVKEAPK